MPGQQRKRTPKRRRTLRRLRIRWTTYRTNGAGEARTSRKGEKTTPSLSGGGFTGCRQRQFRRPTPGHIYLTDPGVGRACKLESQTGHIVPRGAKFGGPGRCPRSTWTTASSGTRRERKLCRSLSSRTATQGPLRLMECPTREATTSGLCSSAAGTCVSGASVGKSWLGLTRRGRSFPWWTRSLPSGRPATRARLTRGSLRRTARWGRASRMASSELASGASRG